MKPGRRMIEYALGIMSDFGAPAGTHQARPAWATWTVPDLVDTRS
jgi:hypothetical protein